MFNLLEAQKAGGIATAKILRATALTQYYKNPNHCKQCNLIIKVKDTQKVTNVRKRKFCDKSCAAIYNNTHKKYGTRRSKLEIYLNNNLKLLYPSLEIICNSKIAIESELDFYFPSLNLAIEINGIFHYEPIFGKDKLESIKNHDFSKFEACRKAEIDLIVIPTLEKYMNKTFKLKYWTQISEIIKRRL